MSEKNTDQTQEILKNGFSDVLKPSPVVNLNEDGGPKRPKLNSDLVETKTWRETEQVLEETKDNEKQLKDTLKKQLDIACESEDTDEQAAAKIAYKKWIVDEQEAIEVSKENQYYLLTDNFLNKITDLEASLLKKLHTQFSNKDIVLNAATVAYNDKIQNTWAQYKERDIVNVSAKLINLYNYLQDRVAPQAGQAQVVSNTDEAGVLLSRDIIEASGTKSATQYVQDGKISHEEFFNQAGQVVMTKNYLDQPFIKITKDGIEKDFASDDELYIWWLEQVLTPEAILVVGNDSRLYETVMKSETLKSRVITLP